MNGGCILMLFLILFIGIAVGSLVEIFGKRKAFGPFGNISIGMLGAFIGSLVRIGGFVGDVVGAALGAAIFLFLFGLLKKSRN